MNKIEELLHRYCPNGVQYKTLGETCDIKTGKGITKIDCSINDKYPIISGGKKPMGYFRNFNRFENTVTISRVGANAGFVSFIDTNFYLNDKCFSIQPVEKYKDYLQSKFLFHVLKEKESDIIGMQSEGGVPTINSNKVSKISFPIPPLPIQQEIVNILDKFTQLQAELEAELEARKVQYEYYRDKLLDFENNKVQWNKLSEVCINISSGKNNSREANGKYPVYGSTGIIGATNEYNYDEDCLLIARVGAYAGFVYKASGKFDVSDNTLIIKPKLGYNIDFAYHQLTQLKLNKLAKGGGQPLITAGCLKDLIIAIPNESEQINISGILEKFNKLINDPLVGISGELNARKKQYEYYRNKLLTLKEKSA